jgi:sulfate permease, SulP family
MIEIKHFKKMFYFDKVDFGISVMVALVTVLEDPIVGILMGATISMLILMKKLSTGHYELQYQIDTAKYPSIMHTPDTFVYSIKGELAYINAQAHVARFEKHLPTHNHIVIDLQSVRFIDHDGIQACEEIIRLLQHEKKSVSVVGTHPMITKLMSESKTIHDVSIHV